MRRHTSLFFTTSPTTTTVARLFVRLIARLFFLIVNRHNPKLQHPPDPFARAMPSPPTCTSCRVSSSKYKCPVCRAPTCSLACSKSHKQSCTNTPINKPADKSASSSTQSTSTTFTPTFTTRPSSFRSFTNRPHHNPLCVSGDDPTITLNPSAQHALTTSQDVMFKLRDPRALAAVRRILAAKDTTVALAIERADPDFEALCDDVLDVLECRREDGTLRFEHLTPDPRSELR